MEKKLIKPKSVKVKWTIEEKNFLAKAILERVKIIKKSWNYDIPRIKMYLEFSHSKRDLKDDVLFAYHSEFKERFNQRSYSANKSFIDYFTEEFVKENTDLILDYIKKDTKITTTISKDDKPETLPTDSLKEETKTQSLLRKEIFDNISIKNYNSINEDKNVVLQPGMVIEFEFSTGKYIKGIIEAILISPEPEKKEFFEIKVANPNSKVYIEKYLITGIVTINPSQFEKIRNNKEKIPIFPELNLNSNNLDIVYSKDYEEAFIKIKKSA